MSYKITVLSLDLALGRQSGAKTAKIGQEVAGAGLSRWTDGQLKLAINTKYGGQGKGIT
jgi:hypothetical protein